MRSGRNTKRNMHNLKKLGELYQTIEGEIVFIPFRGEVGTIVKQPTPEDVDISKEKKEDYSLDGRLKKMSEKDV